MPPGDTRQLPKKHQSESHFVIVAETFPLLTLTLLTRFPSATYSLIFSSFCLLLALDLSPLDFYTTEP